MTDSRKEFEAAAKLAIPYLHFDLMDGEYFSELTGRVYKLWQARDSTFATLEAKNAELQAQVEKLQYDLRNLNNYCKEIDASRVELSAKLTTYESWAKQEPVGKVDEQGIAFGKNCWISHESITGCTAEQLSSGYGIIERGYMEFFRSTVGKKLFTHPVPPPDEYTKFQAIAEDYVRVMTERDEFRVKLGEAERNKVASK